MKEKRRKKLYYAKNKHKKAAVTTVISDKAEFKWSITRNSESHFIMTEGPVYQEDITILNI